MSSVIKKAASLFLLSVLCSASCLPAQSLTDYLDEAIALNRDQKVLIESLKLDSSKTGEYLTDLENRQDQQGNLLMNLNWVLDDSIAYSKKLEKERNFWRIIGGALAVSLLTTITVMAVNNG
jgi:hypothetical protein